MSAGRPRKNRREVILEASQDVEGHAARKAPDYAFRFGADTVFYVEAKKPGVAIKTSASAAFQLRRYAWSARLALSLLTDFEESAVYDCRVRPYDQDKATRDVTCVRRLPHGVLPLTTETRFRPCRPQG